jgi:hypothetical protein
MLLKRELIVLFVATAMQTGACSWVLRSATTADDPPLLVPVDCLAAAGSALLWRGAVCCQPWDL